MGRHQSFESPTVIRAARDAFWDKGYDGTSVADLEECTGVNRSSLYHAFGSKRGLFDAAVADYLDTVIRPRLCVLLDDTTGGDALLTYFGGLRATVEALPDGSPRRGCLLVNCAAGLAGHDDAARAVVDGYRAEMTAALRHALAAATGGSEPAQIDECARVLAALSISAMVLARVNREESVATLVTACEHVRTWIAGAARPTGTPGHDPAPDASRPAGDSVLA
jgi:TetR/AcrR family transcriptional repressor of nem operon